MKRSPNTSVLRPLCALLAGVALVATAAAQRAPSGSFGETIDVRVVEVEVVVTDADGQPIAGLGPEDFRLRVDGEVESVDFFSEVRDGRLAPADSTGGPALTAAIEATPGSLRGTAYLVFMDDFFTLPRDRGRLLGQLQRNLAVLSPEDRVALYRYDGKRLSEVAGWSAPGPALSAAVAALEAMPTRGTWRLLDARNVESETEAWNYLERLEENTGRVVAAAASALRVAPPTERRRAALLLSGGWAYDPARLARPSAVSALESADLYRVLTDTANQLGYALYPVDVPGFEGVPEGADADVGLGAARGIGAGAAGMSTRAIERERHITLRFLAEETGGRPLINATAADALSRVAADERSYYQLAFQTDRHRDDRRHEVVVEVLRPDSSVRARRSFLDDSRTTAVARASEAALLLDRPAGAATPDPGAPPPFQVALGKPKRAGFGKVALPVAMMIPLDALTVLQDGNGWNAHAEVLFGAIEPDGPRSDLPAVPIHWRGKERPAPGSLQPFVTELKLRRGKQDLLVVIHDLRGETILTQRLALDL